MAISTRSKDSIRDVSAALERYAERGVFRGFSEGREGGSKKTYRMIWHRDQHFELVCDARRETLRIPVVLPNVPPNSEMHKGLKAFVKKRQSEEMPPHRRIDPEKCSVKVFNRRSNLSLTLNARDGDLVYGVEKLVHLVHEIYLDFLLDGRYYDYLVETFNLDPDSL